MAFCNSYALPIFMILSAIERGRPRLTASSTSAAVLIFIRLSRWCRYWWCHVWGSNPCYPGEGRASLPLDERDEKRKGCGCWLSFCSKARHQARSGLRCSDSIKLPGEHLHRKRSCHLRRHFCFWHLIFGRLPMPGLCFVLYRLSRYLLQAPMVDLSGAAPES